MSGLPVACLAQLLSFFLCQCLELWVSGSCITSGVYLLLKVCHLVQIFQIVLSILLLFIVLLSEVLVREYERAYHSRHVWLTCISLSFLTLQSFTYEDYTSSCTHASARTAFVSTPAVHIFSGHCSFLLNAEI